MGAVPTKGRSGERVVYQIRLERKGLWHRRSRFDTQTTACGQYILSAFASRDDGDDSPCPICFTREEIDTAKLEKLKKELSTETSDLYFFLDEDPTEPTIPSIAARDVLDTHMPGPARWAVCTIDTTQLTLWLVDSRDGGRWTPEVEKARIWLHPEDAERELVAYDVPGVIGVDHAIVRLP